jgi:hypothetical protein
MDTMLISRLWDLVELYFEVATITFCGVILTTLTILAIKTFVKEKVKMDGVIQKPYLEEWKNAA